jgi:hypothetical protein
LLIDMGLDRGYDIDAKVIKTVLMNSADKLSGWSHTPTAPLDPDFGAGQMNLESAFYQYDAGEQEAGVVGSLGWDHGMLTGATPNMYEIGSLVDIGGAISATLTWNRGVATDVEDIEDAIYSASTLENLELFLYDTDDLMTPVASSISSIDNVEHLFLTAPSADNYVFEVRSASGAVANPLSYSLAWDVEVLPGIIGDFDMDTDIDGFDFLSWQGGETPNQFADYADWETNFGMPAPLLAATTAVPEPSTMTLLCLAGLAFLRGRKR